MSLLMLLVPSQRLRCSCAPIPFVLEVVVLVVGVDSPGVDIIMRIRIRILNVLCVIKDHIRLIIVYGHIMAPRANGRSRSSVK